MNHALLASINSTRNNEGNIILSENADLMSVAFYINDQKINEDRELDNTLFSEALNTFNINGSSKAIGRSSSSWSNIIDSLLDEEAELYNINWQRIGIDISTDSQGTIHCVIILNNQS